MLDDLFSGLYLVADLGLDAWVLGDWVPVFSTGDPPELSGIYDSASRAIAENPSDIQAHFTRGVVCQSKCWYPQALADFMKVVQLDQRHARAWQMLSEVLTSLGKYDQAKIAREEALALVPNLG